MVLYPLTGNILLGCDSFETIEGYLILDAEVTKFIWEAYRGPGLAGCGRAAYKLSVASHLLYDLFSMLRAISIKQGEAANRRLLESLMSKLIAASSGICAESRVRVSLGAQQAKVWIQEEEVETHLAGEE